MTLALLLDHLRETAALDQVSALLSWDQETMMPSSGAGQRAEQAGALAAMIHARHADPRIPDWIEAISMGALSASDQRNVAEAKRAHDRATRIPPTLAQEIAKAASEGHRVWRAARAARDFDAFRPTLEQMVALKQREAACLRETGADLYDGLLDAYEPGARTADLSALLEGLRTGLVVLRERIAGKPAPKRLAGHYPASAQMTLARRVAELIGYSLESGRIDTVAHPFCIGVGGDVRITTRVDEDDPLNCLYSTIHEVGHALYAQGASDPFLPAANFCSMGVHESQSRFWENQIGRSRPFAEWLYPAMREAFDELSVQSPHQLHAAVNRVEAGFIRTEADEVHYNLHILLRFELERDLISGDLATADLEQAWNDRFAQDFGVEVPDPSLGVLQDVHWSAGLFGYFPTYSLGNIYSACLDKAMRRDIPDRDRLVEQGETQPILTWLRKKIHTRGRLLSAPDLIAEATGESANTAPLLVYLETKFSDLYGL